jgi:hypothetical protein
MPISIVSASGRGEEKLDYTARHAERFWSHLQMMGGQRMKTRRLRGGEVLKKNQKSAPTRRYYYKTVMLRSMKRGCVQSG